MKTRLVLCLLVCSCAGSPTGLLGVKWTDKAEAAAQKLSVRCKWKEARNADFQLCSDDPAHTVEAFGARAETTLYSHQGTLAGMTLQFATCNQVRERVRAEVHKKFGINANYVGWENGALLRFGKDCTLTVAGQALGPVLKDEWLREGMGELFLIH